MYDFRQWKQKQEQAYCLKEISVVCRHDRQYRFLPERTALLVIDLQQEFFAENGEETHKQMLAILPRIETLLALARKLGCTIIHTRESYQPDLGDVSAFRKSLGYIGKTGPLGRFCIRGEPGQEFVPQCRPQPGETVIDKAAFSAFYETDLDALLQRQNIDHLILCGVTTQACVHSTLRNAVDLGYWCLTVADCCAASEPDLHEATLQIIAGEGHLFGWISDLVNMENAVT